jgi:transposase-like protein
VDGVDLFFTDDHAGLRASVRKTFMDPYVERCYVLFLRNALDHLPRKADDERLQEKRGMDERRDLKEAKADLAAWMAKCAPPTGEDLMTRVWTPLDENVVLMKSSRSEHLFHAMGIESARRYFETARSEYLAAELSRRSRSGP